MMLYHTSNCIVDCPDTCHSRKEIDFGPGFYLTSIREQAVNYGKRFIRAKEEAWLNTYEFNNDLTAFKVKIFPHYDEEWLDFVAANRNGDETEYFDVVIGGIANDKVIRTLEVFFAGLASKEDTLGKLIYEQPNIQYCIRSQQVLKECLRYINSEKL